MKRSQKKFMQQLQARMNAFILELATITKMLQVCADPDCTSGCKLDKIKTCSDPDCTSGCSLGEIELCADPDCTSGCKGGQRHSHGSCDCGCHNSETSAQCGGDDGDDGDGECHERNCDCSCNCDDDCDCGCNDGGKCEDKDCNSGCREHKCDCGCEDEDFCGVEMDYLNLAKQIQADFDNYRRRNKDAISSAMFEGEKNAISDFLPILDTINKAVALVKEEDARRGLELIRNSFEETLQKLGVTPIDALGLHYNPNLHNVVLSEESEKESGIIIEELEKGYMFKGAVLKHSTVKIAK